MVLYGGNSPTGSTAKISNKLCKKLYWPWATFQLKMAEAQTEQTNGQAERQIERERQRSSQKWQTDREQRHDHDCTQVWRCCWPPALGTLNMRWGLVGSFSVLARSACCGQRCVCVSSALGKHLAQHFFLPLSLSLSLSPLPGKKTTNFSQISAHD